MGCSTSTATTGVGCSSSTSTTGVGYSTSTNGSTSVCSVGCRPVSDFIVIDDDDNE
jgi:hypothetical protein